MGTEHIAPFRFLVQCVGYFEFLSATEDTALEASRAYIDVLRFRRLVSLAEDNYVQHKYAHNQLQTKVKAGVGRGVDSEQANARLALADSNLTTEVANLHDVSARYMRVVGEAPEPALGSPKEVLTKNLSASNADAVTQALARNTAISATIENVLGNAAYFGVAEIYTRDVVTTLLNTAL